MRVLAFAGFQKKAAGDLRIFLGKLRAHPAQIRQFPFIVKEQIVSQATPSRDRNPCQFQESCQKQFVPERAQSSASLPRETPQSVAISECGHRKLRARGTGAAQIAGSLVRGLVKVVLRPADFAKKSN